MALASARKAASLSTGWSVRAAEAALSEQPYFYSEGQMRGQKFAIRKKIAKNQSIDYDLWQLLRESNPSFQIENLAS